jgi:hypothetical protein
MPAPQRRGAASKGLILAMVFGIAGGGLAAWTLMKSLSAEKRPIGPPALEGRGGHERAQNGGGEGEDVLASPNERVRRAEPAEPMTFAPIEGDADVEGLISELRNAVSNAAGASQEMASLGAEAQSKLAESFGIAITPYLKGDAEGLRAAATALGAAQPELAPQSAEATATLGPNGRPNPIIALLKHASIDVTKAQVRPWRGPQERPGANIDRAGEGDDRPSAVIAFRTTGLYTDIDEFEQKKLPAVEVRAPLLPKGSKPEGEPTWIGAVMVWNQNTRTWQPAQINVMSNDPETLRGIMSRVAGGAK